MARQKSAHLTRRTFLKGAGVTAAGAAAAVPITNATVPMARQAAVRVRAPAGTGKTTLSQFTVNGTLYQAAVDPGWTLADFLREQLLLTGTKVGCDRAECGSCTVVMDGKAVFGCSVLAIEAADHDVQTVEGLANGEELNKLQRAFYENGAVQCGFCTPGMLMSATALLAAKPRPTADDVRLAISGNLCRCTGYTKIVDAVMRASQS